MVTLRRYRDEDDRTRSRGTMIEAVTLTSMLTPDQREEMTAMVKWMVNGRMTASLDASPRARAYLDARGVAIAHYDQPTPLTQLTGLGIGYIPADAKLTGIMARWKDRIIFPINSPSGAGFLGYSLQGWEPGMDPQEHEFRFTTAKMPPLWEHAGHPGWFGFDSMVSAADVIVVKDPWDALTIHCAKLCVAQAVVAFDGTALFPEWLPANVETLTLAYADYVDTDMFLAYPQFHVDVVPITHPDYGANWNQRWRKANIDALTGLRLYLHLDDATIAYMEAHCDDPLLHEDKHHYVDMKQRRIRCALCVTAM